jgi:hypothetical protein
MSWSSWQGLANPSLLHDIPDIGALRHLFIPLNVNLAAGLSELQ